MFTGYWAISGRARCGSVKASVESYYSATQPPPVVNLLRCVQCITGWAVGGGTQGLTNLRWNTISSVIRLYTASCIRLFVPGLVAKWIRLFLFQSLAQHKCQTFLLLWTLHINVFPDTDLEAFSLLLIPPFKWMGLDRRQSKSQWFLRKQETVCTIELNRLLMLVLYEILFPFIDYQPNTTHAHKGWGLLTQASTFLSSAAMFTCDAARTFCSSSYS